MISIVDDVAAIKVRLDAIEREKAVARANKAEDATFERSPWSTTSPSEFPEFSDSFE